MNVAFDNLSSYMVSLVILTWNSEQYIIKCLDSYSRSFLEQEVPAEFIVIDNNSNDNTTKLVDQYIEKNTPKNTDISLIRLGKNYGTTFSRNIGLKKSSGKFLIICDSDTEFFSGNWKNAFSLLETQMVSGILAPGISYPDGTVQNSVKKFPTLTDKILKIPKILFNLHLGDRDFYEDFPWLEMQLVDSAISACWIFNRETFLTVGLLDENIFYSPEDLDYCLRVWEKGQHVYFYPDIKIVHHTQQITHKKPLSRQSLCHFRGLIYYFIKHRYLFSRDRLMKRLLM